MANSPTDTVPSIMMENLGTTCLITSTAADKYLNRASRENPNQKKFTEFCGTKGGWDDFTERWH